MLNQSLECGEQSEESGVQSEECRGCGKISEGVQNVECEVKSQEWGGVQIEEYSVGVKSAKLRTPSDK
jgi:hypothetical protein